MTNKPKIVITAVGKLALINEDGTTRELFGSKQAKAQYYARRRRLRQRKLNPNKNLKVL